ncbi:1-acyl-sn-glycerol-3-phosphate acyltransferase [Patescibacteria group bacterium]|nr:1-acyl-sn-glycerol-3-phosphate acyltransferase [Patescibacteria group bacterium]
MNKLYFISPLILQTAIWPITWLLFNFFLHLKIQGLENFKHLPRGVIFASNHSSEWDVILIPASLPFLSSFMPMFYVASEDKEFKHPRFGWKKYLYGGFFFKAWGAYPITKGKQNYDSALKTHIRLLQQKRSLSVFPEGGIRSDNIPQTAHGGVSFLAHKTGVPIIPVAINGISKITCTEFILRKRDVTIYFGKPLYSKDIFDDSKNVNIRDYKDAAKRVMKGIYNQV